MAQPIGQVIDQAVGISFSGNTITVEFLQLSINQQFANQSSLTLTPETATASGIISWVQAQAQGATLAFTDPQYVMLSDTEDYQELAWGLRLNGKSVRILLERPYKDHYQSLGLSPGTEGVATVLAKIACLTDIPRWQPISPNIKEIKDLLLLREPHLKTKSFADKTSPDYLQADQELAAILIQINTSVNSDAALQYKVNLLRSIPGVELITAAKVIGETNGFALFTSIKQLILYAGYAKETWSTNTEGETIVVGESGVPAIHGNAPLRGALYHPAQNLRNSEVFYQALYDRLLPQIGEAGAEIAVQKKLLGLMFSLWKQNQSYVPLTAYEVIMQQLEALQIRLKKTEIARHLKVMRTAQIDEQLYHANYVGSAPSFSITTLQTEQTDLNQEITDHGVEISQIQSDIAALESQRPPYESAFPDVERINISITNALVHHQMINLLHTEIEETTNYQHQLTELEATMPEMGSANSTLTNELTALQNDETAFENLFDAEVNAILTIDPTFTQWPVSQAINLNSFPVETPIALFPVRVETRFMELKHVQRINSPLDNLEGVRDKHELWVRIFPDEVLTKTHEEALTDDELAFGQVYWDEVWKDHGNDAHKLGAWRSIASSFGSERAAWIIKVLEPSNIANIGNDPSPIFPTVATKEDLWTDAAYSDLLPDNFVVRLYKDQTYREVIGKAIPSSLSIGLVPTDDEDAYDQVDGLVDLPEEIKWIGDFHEAVEKGMALRIPLMGLEMYEGFDRLLLVGVKNSKTKTESQTLLENLIDNHHYTNGFEFLPQGTPTNNSSLSKAGYSSQKSGWESSFELEVGNSLISLESDSLLKSDGQRFAEALGIQADVLSHIGNSNAEDIKEALAMNQALWPSTLGYYLEQMLAPLMTDAEIEQVRGFFIDHVLGRGHIPTFRVGKQPYGVLLTTAFSRWKYPSTYSGVSQALFSKVLRHLDIAWQGLIPSLSHTGQGTDLEGTLANLLSQHATSVNYYQQFAMGRFLIENIFGFGPGIVSPFSSTLSGADFGDWFRGQGFNFAQDPRFFDFVYLLNSRVLDGPLIDTAPLSESRLIKPIPGTTLNYIGWLRQSNLDQIHAEDFSNIGASGSQYPPQSLLYLMLRHGVMLSYLNGAYQLNPVGIEERLQYEFQNLNPSGADNFSIEKESMLNRIYQEELRRSTPIGSSPGGGSSTPIQRVDDLIAAPSLKWNYLEATSVSQTSGDSIQTFIDAQRQTASPSTAITVPELTVVLQQQAALEILEQMPTANLERCFAEHVDLTSYRLDGWMSGLIHERLVDNRALSGNDTGLFLGAYAWLENIRPGNFPGFEVVEIPNPNLVGNGQGFKYLGGPNNGEIVEDPETGKIVVAPRVNASNQGFIHAPSMSHATTAAVMRNGYLSHIQTEGANPLAINLSSDRIRKALYFLEGIRNGQALGALLGYQLERAMHEGFAATGLPSMDNLILEVRAKYPLVAGGVVAGESFDSTTGTTGDIEAEESKQVIDGLALIEAYRIDTVGWATGLSFTNDPQVMSFFDAQIRSMINHIDAIADLTMAESIYQMVQGNHDRAAGMLNSFNGRGGSLQEPEVIRTPRRGHALTHRVGIHFDPLGTQKWPAAHSLRSLAESGLNGWLASMLPEPLNIKASVTYFVYDAATDIYTQIEEAFPVSTLDIQPIDLIYMVGQSGEGENASVLAETMKYYIKTVLAQQETQPITLDFYSRDFLQPSDWTIGELIPLIKELSSLVSGARALRPGDMILASQSPNAESTSAAIDLVELRARVEGVFGSASPLPTEYAGVNFTAVIGELNSTIDLAAAVTEAILDQVGIPEYNSAVSAIEDLRSAIKKASAFGLEGSVPVNGTESTWAALQALLTQANRVWADMKSKEAEINLLLLTMDDPETGTNQKIETLEKIAHLIFGRAFRLFPHFSLLNESDHVDAQSRTDLLAEGGAFSIIEWWQGIAKVRPKMSQYQRVSMLSELITETDFPTELNATERLQVVQLPVDPDANDRWLGITFPEDYEIPPEILSLVMDHPANYAPADLQCGMLIDEWVESIPEKTLTTGIASHYDQPNSEPPQTVLLAVSPETSGNWKWDDLMQTVFESLDMAKKRAVDPEILKATSYPQVFPAIMYAISSGNDAPSLDLARNVEEVPAGTVGPVHVSDTPNDNNNPTN